MMQRQLLRDECLHALSNYIHQAQKTCELLGGVEGNAIPLAKLLAILEQTRAEDEVRESYMALRQRLFDTLSEAELENSQLQVPGVT